MGVILMKRCPAIFGVCLAGLLMLSGCALLNIPKDIRHRIAKDIKFKDVLVDPEAFKGKTVMWGGQVLKVTHAKEGTYMEILQTPLTWEGVPSYADQSEGRFLLLSKRYLDPAVYLPRRKVTIAGQILGKTEKPLQEGGAEYSYPLVSGDYVYLWPKVSYPRRYYPSWDSRWDMYPYRYSDPYYYDSFYIDY
jgi:outer membrane lipoprotein